MERLTARDKKGRAYFDDDGALIRGANGTFHQKKDMTGQFIHQRFVALDKAIDRLSAYEDTGLEPEEIMALIFPPNPPLTLDELREMDGEPVWVERHSHFDCTPHWALVHVHRSGDVYLTERNCGQILFIIGDKVYRRKPEEESR